MSIEKNTKYRRREFVPLDIYSYINSPDVAKHCREIGKVWTPLEMAVLIDRSHRPIAEKHTAWREIIAAYPDMPVPVNDKGGSHESLHKKLAERIDYEEHLLEIFKKTEVGAVYRYNDWSGSYTDPDHVFNNFETALVDAVKYYKSQRDRVHAIRMTKSFINDDDHMTAFFNNDDNLDCVRIVGSRKQDKIVLDITKNGCAFDAYVDIPMPFKRGDILTYHKGWDKEDDGIIFVFDTFDRDNPKWLEKHASGRLRSAAEKVRGFCVEESGQLYDYVSEYDHEQLAYYRGKLEGHQQLLHYISLYLKGEIRLPELLTMQCRIMLQQQMDNNLRLLYSGKPYIRT